MLVAVVLLVRMMPRLRDLHEIFNHVENAGYLNGNETRTDLEEQHQRGPEPGMRTPRAAQKRTTRGSQCPSHRHSRSFGDWLPHLQFAPQDLH